MVMIHFSDRKIDIRIHFSDLIDFDACIARRFLRLFERGYARVRLYKNRDYADC